LWHGLYTLSLYESLLMFLFGIVNLFPTFNCFYKWHTWARFLNFYSELTRSSKLALSSGYAQVDLRVRLLGCFLNLCAGVNSELYSREDNFLTRLIYTMKYKAYVLHIAQYVFCMMWISFMNLFSSRIHRRIPTQVRAFYSSSIVYVPR